MSSGQRRQRGERRRPVPEGKAGQAGGQLRVRVEEGVDLSHDGPPEAGEGGGGHGDGWASGWGVRRQVTGACLQNIIVQRFQQTRGPVDSQPGVFVLTGLAMVYTGGSLPIAYVLAAVPFIFAFAALGMLGSAIPTTGGAT